MLDLCTFPQKMQTRRLLPLTHHASMDSPIHSMYTVTCTSRQHALLHLRTAHEQAKPLMMRDFWKHFHPASSLLEPSIDFLRRIVASTTSVMVYCQSEPGAFPRHTLENVPFHLFLDEWQRRRDEEDDGNEKKKERVFAETIGPSLASYDDIFLGNAHIEALSSELLGEVGESPFLSVVEAESDGAADEGHVAGSTKRWTASSSSPSSTTATTTTAITTALSPVSEERGRLWMGNGGHVSHLHFDAHHGLLITLSGHKRVTLYEPLSHMGIIHKSPEGNFALENPFLHPLHHHHHHHHHHQQQQHRHHQHRHDQTAPPPPLSITLDLFAGDALFIPLYWWHLVESVTSSIAINFWHYPDLPASVLKFTSHWHFTRSLLLDHIRAICHLKIKPTPKSDWEERGTPGKNLRQEAEEHECTDTSPHPPSRLSLLSSTWTLLLLESILRFKLHPHLLSQDATTTTTDWSWSSLQREAYFLIRLVIANPNDMTQ